MRIRQAFIAIAASLLLACNASGVRKPLMGGDISGEQSVRAVAVDGDSAALVVAGGDSASAADSLELPALRSGSGEQILRRSAYTASYNAATKLPHWVAWTITAEKLEGTHGRKGLKFREDEEVPEPRATDWDYYNSGYDRGHMCPSADCKWSAEAQLESFLFTNACPQVHGLNFGDWNEIEQQCRRWARQYGTLYIVSGPILYRGVHKRIGKNKVVVPEAFFKVVLRMGESPRAIGFIYKNVSGDRPKSSYVNTVDEVERIAGFDFFPALPDEVEDRVEAEADIEEWGIR